MHMLLRSCLAACFLFAPALAAAQENGAVPSPREILGFDVGESGNLAEWSQITGYFERLAAASPMVRLERIGTTTQDRPMIMAVITSEANQQRLDEIRANQARIADPRDVSPDELERLIDGQPAVAFIGASLHGNEIMATQMSMELAHDLVTDPELQRSLEDVVLLLVPGMNPDGLDITRDWWLTTRGTQWTGARMPWLYHFYVGHDNNRDFFMVTQPETQAVTEVLYRQWFPEVVYDVHQMGNRDARYFIPPFDDPLNPNIHPLIVRMTNLVGVQMALDLTEAGKTGIVHQDTYDLWWHGGGRTVPARHNMIGILSEAASADYGDPIQQDTADLEQPMAGSMFPEPWAGGEWRPRDIVEYELISAKSLVNLLARQRMQFVRNFARLAQEQVEEGREGGPFAYVVPSDQADPGSAAEMLRVLQKGGIEIHEARAPFSAGGQSYPEETRVVLMAQPFRAHAKDLLETQAYPDIRAYPGGPPDVPYDVAGWTLPYAMGVEAVAVDEPFATEALGAIDSISVHPGTVRGERGALAYALDPRMNAANRAVHEVLQAGGQVNFASIEMREGGVSWPVGAPLVWGMPDLRERVERWAQEWGLDATALEKLPHEGFERLRVGLYKPWTGSMDEGWTRFIFDQWEVPYDTLQDARIRQGNLAGQYDVLVIPDLTYESMIRGLDPDDNPPEYAGGLGEEGAAALAEFVREGGTLVLLDSSSEFAIRELGVSVRDITPDRPDAAAWYAPGSLLRVRWDSTHPLAYGMPEESAVYYARSPVFEVEPGAENVTVVARYPERDLLLSGYAQSEEQVAGKAALIEAEVGQGKVVMFGFRPQHRAQPHETFKVFFNSLYSGARR